MSDHMHVLLQLSSDQYVDRATELIRNHARRWMWRHGRTRFNWRQEYAAFSVSSSDLPMVREYLRNQEGHHEHFGFKEEFEALLRKHDIKYNAEALWDG